MIVLSNSSTRFLTDNLCPTNMVLIKVNNGYIYVHENGMHQFYTEQALKALIGKDLLKHVLTLME